MRIRERLDAVAIVEPGAPPRPRDAMLAAVLGLSSLLFFTSGDAVSVWAQVVTAVVSLAFVPFRRVIPLTAVLTVVAVETICWGLVLADRSTVDLSNATAFTSIVLIYALCRWASPLRVVIGLVANGASALFVEWMGEDLHLDDFLRILPWVAVAGFALAQRYRARMLEQRSSQIRLIERNALARELHDTVAHHVSAIAVQAQAAQYVADADPQAAINALRTIETIANDSIEEMRRTVGILRSDADHTRTVAAESLDELADLTGRPVIHVTGEPLLSDLPAGVGAALFRIAQESITNARRHSRGVTFAEVAVTRHDDHVLLTVDNDGNPTTRSARGGYGHIGMRERVDALGGTFDSGPRATGGWRTTTTIPLERFDR